MVAPISLLGAPGPATITALKIVQTGQDLAQGGGNDLLQGLAGRTRQASGAIGPPMDLQPKLASGAVMVASDLDPGPEINIPPRGHLAVRKEAV
jgi:hypothetical protein